MPVPGSESLGRPSAVKPSGLTPTSCLLPEIEMVIMERSKLSELAACSSVQEQNTTDEEKSAAATSSERVQWSRYSPGPRPELRPRAAAGARCVSRRWAQLRHWTLPPTRWPGCTASLLLFPPLALAIGHLKTGLFLGGLGTELSLSAVVIAPWRMRRVASGSWALGKGCGLCLTLAAPHLLCSPQEGSPWELGLTSLPHSCTALHPPTTKLPAGPSRHDTKLLFTFDLCLTGQFHGVLLKLHFLHPQPSHVSWNLAVAPPAPQWCCPQSMR